MRTPVFIVGPTAVGKTEVATVAAERCGAQIVNADAFQLYAGLDLLTAKPSDEQRRRAPHHLVGTVPLSTQYNVAAYEQEARRCLDALAQKRCPTLVVGGSGMYIKALTHGLSILPPAQPALREELEALDLLSLRHRLTALDPVSANLIDTKNKRRLIRAIEVCVTSGRRFSEFRDQWKSSAHTPGSAGILLVRDKSALNARIERRVHHMFSQGLIEEIRAIQPEQVSETASRIIGWREVRELLDGRIDLQDCMDQITSATQRYAKRQITWFRKETAFERCELASEHDADAAVKLICNRLNAMP